MTAREDEPDAANTTETAQRSAAAAAAPAPMIETQGSIVAWADETFGDAGSTARVAARANEEMAELLRLLTIEDAHPNAAGEIADVVILLYEVAHRLHVNLGAEIDKKMLANRARLWPRNA